MRLPNNNAKISYPLIMLIKDLIFLFANANKWPPDRQRLSGYTSLQPFLLTDALLVRLFLIINIIFTILDRSPFWFHQNLRLPKRDWQTATNFVSVKV